MAKRSSKASAPTKPSARLNHPQRVAWLRLIQSENVGPATFLCAEAEAEAELEAAESLGAHLVAIGEPGYPPALAQVDAPPPLI